MTDDKATNDEQVADLFREHRKQIAVQFARDRRERIATAMLAGGFFAGIREAIDAADELIRELDKEGGR